MTSSSSVSVSAVEFTVTVCGVCQSWSVKVSGDGFTETSAPEGTVTVTVTLAVGFEVSTTV